MCYDFAQIVMLDAWLIRLAGWERMMMAKKPILTDDFLEDGAPVSPVSPHVPAPAAHPTAAPQAAPGVTRPVTPPEGARATQPPDPTRPASAPQPGRDASGHARPRTRILGYGVDADAASTPCVAPDGEDDVGWPVGWLAIMKGPGRGQALPLMSGMNTIGRGEACGVQIDFGDTAISREAHAYVTYDDEARLFFVSHAGKANLVRLNGAPVLATEALRHGDTLRIGATSLRFVALCGSDFDWSDP